MDKPKFVLRACCGAGAECGKGYVSSEDGKAGLGFGYTGKPGPPVAEIQHEVEERVAWHEAAHATLGHGFGWTIESVSVVPPECVRFNPGEQRDVFQRIVNSLAGAAGEDARVRWFITESDANVADFVGRAIAFQGGRCDQCSAAMGAWSITGTNAEKSEAVAVWRRGEHRAAELLARPDVRAAVADLADHLLQTHSLDGERAHQIIATHIGFGSLSAAGKDEAHAR